MLTLAMLLQPQRSMDSSRSLLPFGLARMSRRAAVCQAVT